MSLNNLLLQKLLLQKKETQAKPSLEIPISKPVSFKLPGNGSGNKNGFAGAIQNRQHAAQIAERSSMSNLQKLLAGKIAAQTNFEPSSNKLDKDATPRSVEMQVKTTALPVQPIQKAELPAHKEIINKAKEVLRSETQATTLANKAVDFNTEQLLAVQKALAPASETREMCIIGAAGTGKTTVVKEIRRRLQDEGRLPIYGHNHKYLPFGAPSICFCSFTNRAVRNLRRVLPSDLADNCITIHALLEYYFEFFEELDEESGKVITKRRAIPARSKLNPLHGLKFLVVDESSMVGTDLWSQLYESLDADCKIIFLGDLNQLPPVYSSAILGYKLVDSKIPVVELTQVYRQALDNPILAFAHSILRNEAASYSPKILREGLANKEPNLLFKPMKKRVEWEVALPPTGRFFQQAIQENFYDPEEDCILIPYNKAFGSIELNKYIGQKLSEMQEKPVYEVFSGYLKHYFSIGDRILLGKYEGRITQIVRNSKYFGKQPRPESILLDRWGMYRKPKSKEEENKFTQEFDGGADESLGHLTEHEIDNLLDSAKKNEDAKRAASHIVTVEIAETGDILDLDEAGEINAIIFAWAITVHKSQGAEWRRVFFILHNSHSTMLSRELLYTGVTRAREQLILMCEADSIQKGIERQRIKGQTLAEKAEFFKGKIGEVQTPKSGFTFQFAAGKDE